MSFRRRVRVSGVNVKDVNAQAPKHEYQQWLVCGCLCVSKTNLVLASQVEGTVPWVYAAGSNATSLSYAVVTPGDIVIYAGELSRNRIKDAWASGGVRIEVRHQFFVPRHGLIVADPTFFKDAFAEDELKA